MRCPNGSRNRPSQGTSLPWVQKKSAPAEKWKLTPPSPKRRTRRRRNPPWAAEAAAERKTSWPPTGPNWRKERQKEEADARAEEEEDDEDEDDEDEFEDVDVSGHGHRDGVYALPPRTLRMACRVRASPRRRRRKAAMRPTTSARQSGSRWKARAQALAFSNGAEKVLEAESRAAQGTPAASDEDDDDDELEFENV